MSKRLISTKLVLVADREMVILSISLYLNERKLWFSATSSDPNSFPSILKCS